MKEPFDLPSLVGADVSPEALDLLEKLLVRDPEERLTAQEALLHPWIAGETMNPHADQNPAQTLPDYLSCTPSVHVCTVRWWSAHDRGAHVLLAVSGVAPDMPLQGSIVQRLQRFATYGHLKQMVFGLIANTIKDEAGLVRDGVLSTHRRGCMSPHISHRRGCMSPGQHPPPANPKP